MKLVLGNLTLLKVWLLNESLRSQTQWDTALQLLGKGVAGRFEKYCNRSFERVVGDVFEFSADRSHVCVPRFPVEVLTTIQQRDNSADAWATVTSADLIQNQDLAKGMFYFGSDAGDYLSRLRFTYTGGYWVPNDDTPETDANLPAGATLVPDDLKAAWLLQCERVWSVRDNMGTNVAGDNAVTFVAQTLAALELVPEVKEILNGYRRFTLT